MDKVRGSSQTYQAQSVDGSQDSSKAASKLMDAAGDLLGKIQQSTQSDVNTTKQQIENHRALQLAVNVTGQLDDAVNKALASIKSDGSSDDSSSSSDDSSSSVGKIAQSLSPLKSQLKQNLVDNILGKAGNLDPSNQDKFQQDLTDIQVDNCSLQQDISAQIQDASKDFQNTKSRMSSNGAEAAVGRMTGSLNIMADE